VEEAEIHHHSHQEQDDPPPNINNNNHSNNAVAFRTSNCHPMIIIKEEKRPKIHPGFTQRPSDGPGDNKSNSTKQ